jgi:exosortase/archaeosortase family protein
MYRGPVRRTLFIIVSVIVPIIANGIRALGTVTLGHFLGSAEAAAADHLLYGWIFLSLVTLLLIFLGLPFRQDNTRDQAQPAPREPPCNRGRQAWGAALLTVVLGAIGPVLAVSLSAASAAPSTGLLPLDLSPICASDETPATLSAGKPAPVLVERMTCGGTPMVVEIELFSPRSTASVVTSERRRLTRPANAEEMSETSLTSPWRLMEANEQAFFAAAGAWIDGEPATPGLSMRLRMARSSLAGGDYAPSLVVIKPDIDWRRVDPGMREQLKNQISDLVRADTKIGDQIRSMARAAR